MSDFNFYASQIVDGIAYGSIYGTFALSIVLLYRANKIFNFALTEIVTLLVMITLVMLKSFSYVTAVLVMIALSFGVGCLLHLTLVRFVSERRQTFLVSQSVITIGLFKIFNSLSSYLFGDEPQPFPSPFGEGAVTLHGIVISHYSLGVFGTCLFMVLIIYLCFRYTQIGLTFEAVAQNIDAARLRGIRASNVLALAWGVTIMTGVIAGILIAPILYVTPDMLTTIYAYSLIAVVIGGLESPLGALVGGVIVGVVENVASNASFIGSELKFVVVMILLFTILIIKPRGLWGRSEARRV